MDAQSMYLSLYQEFMDLFTQTFSQMVFLIYLFIFWCAVVANGTNPLLLFRIMQVLLIIYMSF